MENLTIEAGIRPSLIEDAMQWRYATKVFDKEKAVSENKFNLLMEVLRLSPSSIGIQPWKFIHVKKMSVRQEMFKLSMLQKQMIDASDLIVLCSLSKLDASYINKLVELDKKQTGGNSKLEPFKAFALSYIESKSKEELREWMAQQVYIALGFLLSACAMLHIDACPMEAFDHEKVDKLLELDKQGVECRVAVAIGYRSQDDAHAKDRKLRWPSEEVVITI